MPVVQITYDVPLSIAKGLTTGELQMLGTAAVRNSTGITAHIREVSRTVGAGDEVIGVSLAKSLRDPRVVAIGLGVVAVAAAASGAAGWVTAKKRAKAAATVSVVADEFNVALSAYLTAVNEGAVDLQRIETLLQSLDSMTTGAQGDTMTVTISKDEWGALLTAIADYTKKLAQANSVELKVDAPTSSGSTTAPIADLRHYLDVQRRMFRDAA